MERTPLVDSRSEQVANRAVDSRSEQVANRPGNHLYARKPRSSEENVNCNDCRRTRLSLCCKGSRH